MANLHPVACPQCGGMAFVIPGAIRCTVCGQITESAPRAVAVTPVYPPTITEPPAAPQKPAMPGIVPTNTYSAEPQGSAWPWLMIGGGLVAMALIAAFLISATGIAEKVGVTEPSYKEQVRRTIKKKYGVEITWWGAPDYHVQNNRFTGGTIRSVVIQVKFTRKTGQAWKATLQAEDGESHARIIDEDDDIDSFR